MKFRHVFFDILAAVFLVGTIAFVGSYLEKKFIVNAQNVPSPSADIADLDAYSFEVITVTGTAIGFTSATINPSTSVGAKLALCTLETANIRYRIDGTDPTTAVGHLAVFTGNPQIAIRGINNIIRFRAISSGSASLSCTYLR